MMTADEIERQRERDSLKRLVLAAHAEKMAK